MSHDVLSKEEISDGLDGLHNENYRIEIEVTALHPEKKKKRNNAVHSQPIIGLNIITAAQTRLNVTF